MMDEKSKLLEGDEEIVLDEKPPARPNIVQL